MRPTQKDKFVRNFNWEKIGVTLDGVMDVLDDTLAGFVDEYPDWKWTVERHEPGKRMNIRLEFWLKDGTRPPTKVKLDHPRILAQDWAEPHRVLLDLVSGREDLVLDHGYNVNVFARSRVVKLTYRIKPNLKQFPKT